MPCNQAINAIRGVFYAFFVNLEDPKKSGHSGFGVSQVCTRELCCSMLVRLTCFKVVIGVFQVGLCLSDFDSPIDLREYSLIWNS